MINNINFFEALYYVNSKIFDNIISDNYFTISDIINEIQSDIKEKIKQIKEEKSNFNLINELREEIDNKLMIQIGERINEKITDINKEYNKFLKRFEIIRVLFDNSLDEYKELNNNIDFLENFYFTKNTILNFTRNNMGDKNQIFDNHIQEKIYKEINNVDEDVNVIIKANEINKLKS